LFASRPSIGSIIQNAAQTGRGTATPLRILFSRRCDAAICLHERADAATPTLYSLTRHDGFYLSANVAAHLLTWPPPPACRLMSFRMPVALFHCHACASNHVAKSAGRSALQRALFVNAEESDTHHMAARSAIAARPMLP